MISENVGENLEMGLATGELLISDPTVWSIYDQVLTELTLMAKQRLYKGDRLSIGLESLIVSCDNILNGVESIRGYLRGLYENKFGSRKPKPIKKKLRLEDHPQLSHVAIDRKVQKGIRDNLEQAQEFIECLCAMLATKQEPQEGVYKFTEGIKWVIERLIKALIIFFPQDSGTLVQKLLSQARESATMDFNLQSLIPNESVLWKVRSEKEWFDFKQNEVVKIENILRSCFLNADRKDFPQRIRSGVLYTDHESPEYFLDRIASEMPSALAQLDATNIHLHNTTGFADEDSDGETVEPDQYLREIKNCRWYGPYQMERTPSLFVFFAWNRRADNLYHARLQLYFELKSVDFSLRKGSFPLADSYCFAQ